MLKFALVLPQREEWAKQVYHLFVVRCKTRDELKDYLQSKDIQTGIHYPIALPKLQAYHYIAQQDEDFFANHHDGELLSLPIGEHMDEHSVKFFVETIKPFFL